MNFNFIDLQSSILLLLAAISLPVSDNIAFEFKTSWATINLSAIGTFYNKICLAIIDHLLIAKFIKNRYFKHISTLFSIMETNRQRIFYLYYLVELWVMTNWTNFWHKICGNIYFLLDLFISQIILLLQVYQFILPIFLDSKFGSYQLYSLIYYQEYKCFQCNTNNKSK